MAALGLFLIISLGLIGWAWVRNQPPSRRGTVAVRLGLGLAVLFLGYLAITGRMHIVGLLLAFTYPLLRRYLPGILRQAKSGTGSGNSSTVTSETLEMSLDHDTGAMHGKVLRGPMEGRTLETLEEHEFIELLQYCRTQDADSARLLETYLDQRFGHSWHEDDPNGDASGQEDSSHGEGSGRGPGQGEMTRDEAYEILGLEPGASREEISQAHRRLIQRMHPDRGGSAYLAARINAARKLLLGH